MKILIYLFLVLTIISCGQTYQNGAPRPLGGNASNALAQRPMGIASSCMNWFDGCNTCAVQMNGAVACSNNSCQTRTAPSCLDQNSPTQNTNQQQAQRPPGISSSCMSWNDGCNDCSSINGQVTCTARSCAQYGAPYCKN